MKEGNISTEIQMEASRLGHRLLRNQTGRYKDPRSGNWISYGLGGAGGSDLIGWTREGLFAAVEVKTPTGRVTPEQQAFIDAVNRAGGRAGVARSVADVVRILG